MDAQGRLTLKRVGIVTAMSVIASVVISLIIFYAATGSFIGSGLGLVIAVIAPGIIAPIASWHSISLSLRLRQANQRLRILSELDSLTSTLNRRTFMETADKDLSLAARHGYPTSLLVLDFDHFKQINDCYGHAMGDQVLVETIDLIRDTIRETDVLARIGGEEFIILLPHTAWEGARLLAERILEVIRNNQVRQRAAMRNDADDGNQTLNVTVTLGGATCATSTTNLDEMMSRADKLLYEAKQAGRDRCVIEAISRSKPVELSRVS
jgi:diguanylate cyclase (GGDEF)-like protein